MGRRRENRIDLGLSRAEEELFYFKQLRLSPYSHFSLFSVFPVFSLSLSLPPLSMVKS
jgi:hypothetical protein